MDKQTMDRIVKLIMKLPVNLGIKTRFLVELEQILKEEVK